MKQINSQDKSQLKKLHRRSKHNSNYSFDALIALVPQLKSKLCKNPNGIDTIDFSDQESVYLLNKALLFQNYNLEYWEIPSVNLCPPIPGRADYIHYLYDLINQERTITHRKILDIGTGASLIYPILGVSEYKWDFIATDVSVASIQNAQKIVDYNEGLKNKISLKLQSNKNQILKGAIESNDFFDAVMMNPPFFASEKEALGQTSRKLKNLKGEHHVKVVNNFSGLSNELWCDGGEKKFVQQYIVESEFFKRNVTWFTTLISNEKNLAGLTKLLKSKKVKSIEIIEMFQGNKKSRILAWKY